MSRPLAYAAILAALLFSSAGVSWAQPERPPLGFRFEAGALFGSDAGLDDGGEMGADRWSVRLGSSYRVNEKLRLGLAAGYGEQRYRFSGGGDFSGLRPWDDVRETRVSASAFWRPTDRWQLFAIPTLRWNTEDGASMSDGQIGGLLTAASYRVNDRLSIGPGLGVFSELEDDTSFFPIIAVDWAITDRISLNTGRGFAASRGPGLTLDWAASDKWSVSLGGRYEKNRFRLDDRGVAPDGIGEVRTTPIFLAVSRKLGNIGTVRGVVGVDLNGSLRLEDRNGDLLEREDAEDAPFAGATFDVRF
jgi:outer membrane receptor protein involved in Fe transport